MATCNKATVNRIKALNLAPIIKMLEPYPIRRYRTPILLKNGWSKMEDAK